MKPHAWFVACVIAGSVLVPTAAQSPPASLPERPQATGAQAPPTQGALSLAAAVDAAWQRAIASREAQGQRERAQADRAVASSLWAAPPALELTHRDDRLHRHAGQRETEVALVWPLWLPGQRAARGALAETAITLADQAKAAARLRIAGEVREAAWALLDQQAQAAQADAQVAALTTLADDVERRVRAGDLARADALAARAERLHATAEQSDARQRLDVARGRWLLLTGLEALPPLDETPAATADADALALHPDMRVAAARTEHARRQFDALRSARRDAPELTLGVRQDVPGRAEPSQGSLAIGLRVPFATADRNRPLEAAALAELDVAQTGEQRARERLASEAAAARAAERAAEQQLAAARERGTLLRERAQLIDKSFRAGESPLPDLLRALAAATQADAATARQQAALGLARARLHQALGHLP